MLADLLFGIIWFAGLIRKRLPPKRPHKSHQNFLISQSTQKFLKTSGVIENTPNSSKVTLMFLNCGVVVVKMCFERLSGG
jgi:hypothetical protein